MSKKNDFVEFIAYDVFSFLDNVSYKKLFDGYGIYRAGEIFAIVIDDTLYLKDSKTNLNLLKGMDSKQFSYEREGNAIHLPYWSVPEDILEDSEEMRNLLNY
ncbi:MAG: TfoX/Sxy family protein [Candidatus Paceibacterota bacterium]